LPSVLLGQSFTVEGNITYRFYVYDKVDREIKRTMVIYVNSPRWLMKIETPNSENAVFTNYTAAFDGTNLYSLGSTPGSVISNIPADMPVYNCTAVVDSMLAPRSVTSVGATFIWFTFAPSAWTNIVVSNVASIIWDDLLLYKHKIMLPVNIQTESSASLVTKVVTWQNDGRLRYEDDQGDIRERIWPKPYDHGYTNAVFSTTMTNVAGVNIPVRASLETYAPDPGGDGKEAKVYRMEHYFLEVTRIVPECRISEFKPDLPPMSYVLDYRLAAGDPLFHPSKFVSNGGAWKVASVQQLNRMHSNFEKFSKSKSGTTDHEKRITRQIAGVTIALITIGTALLALRLSKNTKTTETMIRD